MNKAITVAQFSDWLVANDGVLMDGTTMISFSEYEKGVEECVRILDMDDDFPSTYVELDEDNSSIIQKSKGEILATVVDIHGTTNVWKFQAMELVSEGGIIDCGLIHVIKLDRETENIEDMSSYPETKHGNDCAEEQFKHYCSESFSNWDEYTLTDVEACIENGYEQNGKWKVMIVHF